MLGLKATDIESKTVSDSKSGGEGSTCDAICDTFFQILLGMRLRTLSDSQLENVCKLLDTMPSIHENTNSMRGPILACDRGYGKKSFIEMLWEKNFKVLTIASPVGSDHPIVGLTTVAGYVAKLKALNRETIISMDYVSDDRPKNDLGDVVDKNLETFIQNLEEYTLQDDPNQLLGPEMIVAHHSEISDFFAIGLRDIFDKKIAQKLLRFYMIGFPRITNVLIEWVIVPKKNNKSNFKRLFHPSEKSKVVEHLEDYLISWTMPLTHSQHTADWFTLRGFHLSATMAGRLFTSQEEYSDETVLSMLLSSWFSRSRSTTEMVIGTKHEDAILQSFASLRIVHEVFDCGLFEA